MIARLRRDAVGEVRDDDASRELYAADASIYRRRPVATLRAAAADDLDAAIAACRESGVPLTMRGAGTSLAGQAVGRGLVVDCSALASIAIDPDARTARVGPGVVLDDLNAAAAEHGLAFGPDVASGSRATLGGMIANNSAGARSIAYGLTAGHVRSLEVTLADGTRATLRRGGAAPAALEAARPLAAAAHPAGAPAKGLGLRPRGARGRRAGLAAAAVRLGGHARRHSRGRAGSGGAPGRARPRPAVVPVGRRRARGGGGGARDRALGGGADGALGRRPGRPGPAPYRAERRPGGGRRPPPRRPGGAGGARAGRAGGGLGRAPLGHRQRPARRRARPRRPAAAGVHRGPGRPARAAARAGARRAPDPRARGPERGLVRARERRLPAHPAADGPAPARRRRGAPPDRRGDRGGRLRARRVAVGRARRRPRPQRAAAADVPAGDDRGLRRAQAAARPRAPAEPRRDRGPRAPRRGPAARRLPAAPAAPHRAGLRRGGRPRPRRRGLQRQRRLPLAGRDDVPELPGPARRAPLHPRARRDPARRPRGSDSRRIGR